MAQVLPFPYAGRGMFRLWHYPNSEPCYIHFIGGTAAGNVPGILG